MTYDRSVSKRGNPGALMQEFDPRRPAFRLAPRLMMGVAGCCALALGWRLTGAEAHLPTEGMRVKTGQ